MTDTKPLSKKEIARRKKLSEARERGYRRFVEKRRKEREKKKKEELLKKEKEKARKEKERLKGKKRPVGRPKKRGRPRIRKRTKKANTAPKRRYGNNIKPPFLYKIISCRNGKQNKFIGRYRTIDEAYEVFNRLREEDKRVIFDVSTTVQRRDVKGAINEYILIEKTDAENSVLRNEYGKLVEQRTNIEGWIVLDKFRYKKEETFWVYGYNNSTDRKTFKWIYENILLADIYSRLDYKRALTYKNKVIIKDDNNYIEMIICKSVGDAIKLYNMLEQWTKKDRIKQVLFMGDYSGLSPRRTKLEQEIMALTGWNIEKIRLKTTTKVYKGLDKK